MSSEHVVLGHEAKIRINDQVFAVVGGQITLTSQVHDTSDTEGEGFEDARGGLKKMAVDLEAQWADDVNPFAEPLNLEEGDVIDLKIYPNGLAAGNPYWAPKFLCGQGTHSLGLRQPQGFRVTGQSKRRYYKPGQA